MTSQTRYGLFVILSAVLAAAAWICTEVAITFFEVTPLIVVFGGNIVGGAILISASLNSSPKFYPSWRKRNWLPVLLAAFFIYALAFFLNFSAIGLIGSGKAALLGQLQPPFMVTLAIIFLGEHMSGRRWLAGALAVSGAVLINFDPRAAELSLGWGEILAILGVLTMATGIIILKKSLDHADPQWITGLALLAGALFLTPLLPFYGSTAWLGLATLLVIAIMGLFRGGAWLVFNVALRHIGASRCSILFLSFAFFTVIFQLGFNRLLPLLDLRTPTNLLMAVIGGSFVAAGVILLQTEQVSLKGPASAVKRKPTG